MGPVASDPARSGTDHLSAGYLIALAARIVREVKRLLDRADATSLRLPTLSIDSVIRFRSANRSLLPLAAISLLPSLPLPPATTMNQPPRAVPIAWWSLPIR